MDFKEWKVVPHFQQIADTGDYDGCYEITNGDISIFTKDDIDNDDELIKSLNKSELKLYLSDDKEDTIFGLEIEVSELKKDNEALNFQLQQLNIKE